MVLEAVMLCVDNSDWMRNGDYSPDRFRAQNEAVNMICTAKTNDNAESSVGFLSMAGSRIDVHVTPSRNLAKVMSSLADDVKIGGKSNVLAALKTAQLALKNRQNKNQKQRIMLFVGSPLEADDEKELPKLGKLFKKNNISVDVINFGTENQDNNNGTVLQAFVEAVNRGDSHYVNIPPTHQIFSDMVLSSGIMQVDSSMTSAGASAGAGAGASAGAFAGGVDPNIDPELAMVLRMSMEEDRQRSSKGTTAKPAASGSTAAASSSTSAASSTPSASATTAAPAASSKPAAAAGAAADADADADADGDGDDDDELQKALALSLQQDAAAAGTTAPVKEGKMDTEDEADVDDVLKDKEFLKSLLDEAGVNEEELQDLPLFDDADKDKNKKPKEKDEKSKK